MPSPPRVVWGGVYVPFCPPPLLYHYCSLHLQFLITCSMQKQFYILQAIKNCRLVKSGCDIKLETFSPGPLCSLGSPAHTLLLRPFFIEIIAIPMNLSLNSLHVPWTWLYCLNLLCCLNSLYCCTVDVTAVATLLIRFPNCLGPCYLHEISQSQSKSHTMSCGMCKLAL